MTGWESFFTAQVGASAALVGLIFVGVSINLSRIISLPGLPNRALLALLVVSSLLLLIPGQPMKLVGIEVLVVGLIAWVIVTMLDITILQTKQPQYRQPYAFNMALSQLSVLPYIIVLTLGADGLYLIVAALIISFIKAILDAWVLLVEINR
jgi:hypothetical protein